MSERFLLLAKKRAFRRPQSAEGSVFWIQQSCYSLQKPGTGRAQKGQIPTKATPAYLGCREGGAPCREGEPLPPFCTVLPENAALFQRRQALRPPPAGGQKGGRQKGGKVGDRKAVRWATESGRQRRLMAVCSREQAAADRRWAADLTPPRRRDGQAAAQTYPFPEPPAHGSGSGR